MSQTLTSRWYRPALVLLPLMVGHLGALAADMSYQPEPPKVCLFFRNEVTPAGPVVRLRDVAEVSGQGAAIVNKLLDEELFPAPREAAGMIVGRQLIVEQLRARGYAMPELVVDGPTMIRIYPPLGRGNKAPADPFLTTESGRGPSSAASSLPDAFHEQIAKGQTSAGNSRLRQFGEEGSSDLFSGSLASWASCGQNSQQPSEAGRVGSSSAGTEATDRSTGNRSEASEPAVAFRSTAGRKRPQPLIERGQLVNVYVYAPSVFIRTVARARQDGALGEEILVEAPGTRAVYRAKVSGPQQVTVHVGATDHPAGEARDSQPRTTIDAR